MRRALFVAVLLASLAPVPAGAQPTLRLLDTEVGRISTDARYAAWWSDGELSVRVLDTKTGGTIDYPYPNPAEAGCLFRGIGAGTGVWSCTRGDSYYDEARLLDLATGTITPVTPDPRALPGPQLEFSGVGSHWLSAQLMSSYTDPGTTNHLSLDTHTWYSTSADTQEGQQLRDPNRAIDLSVRGLTRHMCRPLIRRPDGNPSHSELYLPYEYEPPYGLSLGSPDDHVDPVLQRCKGHDRVLRGAHSAQLRAGVLTWVDARGIHASDLSRRVRRTWDLPAFSTPATLDITHTATQLFVRVVRPGEPLFTARLPR